jgi:hypothetical protein
VRRGGGSAALAALCAPLLACGGGAAPAPAVCINELMADNRTVALEGEQTPDWVELANPGAAAAELEGWSLEPDGDTGEAGWALPAGTRVEAGGHLVLAAAEGDEAEDASLPFSLSAQGGTLWLVDPDGAVADQVLWASQVADTSWGRQTDGAAHWTVQHSPSPGAAQSLWRIPGTEPGRRAASSLHRPAARRTLELAEGGAARWAPQIAHRAKGWDFFTGAQPRPKAEA